MAQNTSREELECREGCMWWLSLFNDTCCFSWAGSQHHGCEYHFLSTPPLPKNTCLFLWLAGQMNGQNDLKGWCWQLIINTGICPHLIFLPVSEKLSLWSAFYDMHTCTYTVRRTALAMEGNQKCMQMRWDAQPRGYGPHLQCTVHSTCKKGGWEAWGCKQVAEEK